MSTDAPDIASAIEASYQSTRTAAAAISVLYAQGAATCEDVKGYNLLALGIYNTQKVMLSAAIAAGVDTQGMTTPPTPTLFYWNGTAGTDAALVDCSTASAGVSGFGAAPSFLPRGSIRIVTGDPGWQNPTPAFTASKIASGQLSGPEIPVVIYLLIAGISIAVAVALIEALTAAWQQSEITKAVAVQVQTKAKAASDMWAARAGYMTSCTGDQAACAAQAVQLFPVPDLSVIVPGATSTGLGILAWVGILSIAGVGGALLYRKYKRDGHILPERAEHAG